MKTLTTTVKTTLIGLLIAATSSIALANTNSSTSALDMTTYEVLYVDNVDIIAQQTDHALNELNYRGYLDVQNQAAKNIAYVGARLHLNQQVNLAQSTQSDISEETAQ